MFLYLSCPLTSLSLQGGAEENPVDHGRPCLFPSSLSDDTDGPLVPWLTLSVSSHQLHWQLSIKCLDCVVTGGSTDGQSLCLCLNMFSIWNIIRSNLHFFFFKRVMLGLITGALGIQPLWKFCTEKSNDSSFDYSHMCRIKTNWST